MSNKQKPPTFEQGNCARLDLTAKELLLMKAALAPVISYEPETLNVQESLVRKVREAINKL